MSPKATRQDVSAVVSTPFAVQAETSEADLLTRYLSLSPSKREELFPPTASAAVRVGVSQRTIQAWIDAGLIHAVPIGKKFRVHLESLLNYLYTRAVRGAI